MKNRLTYVFVLLLVIATAIVVTSSVGAFQGWTWDEDAGSTIIAYQQGPHEGNGV